MSIVFPADACMPHPIALLLLALVTVGCSPGPVVATLEARPSGTYGEVMSWTANAPPGTARHSIDVEIEIDPAQMMIGFRSDWQYNVMLDVDVEGAGNVEERWMTFPVTEEKVKFEDETVRQIAYEPVGNPLPTGFHKSGPRTGEVDFKPAGGPLTVTAHIRTPDGADRRVLKAIRTVRLLVRGKGDRVLTEWTEQPRSTRK